MKYFINTPIFPHKKYNHIYVSNARVLLNLKPYLRHRRECVFLPYLAEVQTPEFDTAAPVPPPLSLAVTRFIYIPFNNTPRVAPAHTT